MKHSLQGASRLSACNVLDDFGAVLLTDAAPSGVPFLASRRSSSSVVMPSRLGSSRLSASLCTRSVRRMHSRAALSHVDAAGRAAMVDVSDKPTSARSATARAVVLLGPVAYKALVEGTNAKGDVLATARIAGLLAAKKTADLIPLCHPLLISHAAVEFDLCATRHLLTITASASCAGGTGVEMEAMTAASVAALTVYDMCKAASKGIVISELRLLQKSGGKSGSWHASEA